MHKLPISSWSTTFCVILSLKTLSWEKGVCIYFGSSIMTDAVKWKVVYSDSFTHCKFTIIFTKVISYFIFSDDSNAGSCRVIPPQQQQKLQSRQSNFLAVHKNMTKLKYKIRWPFLRKVTFEEGYFLDILSFTLPSKLSLCVITPPSRHSIIFLPFRYTSGAILLKKTL